MLTEKMLREAMDAMWNAPHQPKQYVAHPSEKAHLESHGGDKMGDPNCDTCQAIWAAMELRASLG